jgi:outer membrane protein assembly factor BamB
MQVRFLPVSHRLTSSWREVVFIVKEFPMRVWLLLACMVCWSATTFAQDWTRFRGPNGSGESNDDSIPAAWNEKDFAWKIALPGYGHSSPVVWGEKVFLMSADPESATRYVLCIHADSGKTLWKKDYASGQQPIHKKSSLASVTPTVDAEMMFTAWSTQEHTFVAGFDHAGKEIWKTDIGGWVGQHGFGTSPIIYGDLVIITSSQEPEKRAGGSTPKQCFVVALDRKSGAIKWNLPRKIDTASYSVPCVRKNDKGIEELVFLSTAEGMFGIDPLSGKELWSSGPVFSMRTVSSPLLWKDLVYGTTGSGGGGNYIVAFRPGETKPVFEIKKEMPYVPTPVFNGDLMFLWSDKGIVTCINPATGEQHWQKRVTGNFSGSPVRAGKKIFCIDENGLVVVIAADQQFQELARNPLNEQSHSTPAIAGGRMFVRTVSHLYAIQGQK